MNQVDAERFSSMAETYDRMCRLLVPSYDMYTMTLRSSWRGSVTRAMIASISFKYYLWGAIGGRKPE